MFVDEPIVDAEISIPGLCPVNSNLCLFRLVRTRRGDKYCSTVPATIALGGSGVRSGSRFSAAILADLAMRGLAISARTRARVALPGSFSAFF